jgi:anaerobic selenocysteine-containing dehydrogenase/Fe-S-cluster-containing dehydrogenase component
MEFSRRTFLKLAGLGSAALGTGADTSSFTRLIPWVVPPDNLPPVIWNTLATTCRECPAGCGMHVMHKDGRITKAEGNPGHPVNRGGLCARGQSALQGIYDPDRVTHVMSGNRKGAFRAESWESAFSQITAKLATGNGKVAMLSRLETGAMAEIMSAFLKGAGSDRLLFYEAFNYEPLRKAHAALFSKAIIPYYHLKHCDYILSFGADFLETWVSNVQFADRFAGMHSLKDGRIGRFDYVGPRLSMTAANADNFVQVSPGYETAVALALLKIMAEENLIRKGLEIIEPLIEDFEIQSLLREKISEERLRGMARRFAGEGDSAALAGPVAATGDNAERLALAVCLLNYAAGRFDTVIDISSPHALSNTATEEELMDFLRALSPEDVLFIHKTNPAFTRPESAEALKKAGLIVYLGTMADETAALSDWYLPTHDDLESWGDYEPWPGVYGLLQPTMRSIADSIGAGDIFIKLAQAAGQELRRAPGGPAINTSYEWVRERWTALIKEKTSVKEEWEDALRNGGSWTQEESDPVKAPALKTGGIVFPQESSFVPLERGQLELWLWPSIMLFDGRTANRGWIQEAPEPVSFNVWGSWIDIHPEKAKELGIEDEDIIELVSEENRKVQAPARITTEINRDAVALALGQGHTALGKIAANTGANGFSLLTANPSGRGYFGMVSIHKTGKKGEIVRAIETSRQHGRGLLRWKGLEEVKSMKPGPVTLPLPEGYSKEHDLYPPHEHRGHRWAMAIDLQRCIGCGACAVACYAENNIPVTGKKEVGKGREMAWLKVVAYFEEENPQRLGWLPLPCQHCDCAPCEPVCPVFAAMHNEEGLNAQIFNRCIGTRYCANNCPYKVRRFNWLNHYWPDPLKWQLNPGVTVRSRGVMEKCTFCVQRIRNAEYQARREDRKIRDGEIQPACVQSCPAKVFTFGDLLEPESKVSKIFRGDPRRYQLLKELNTKPAIAYLYRIEQET